MVVVVVVVVVDAVADVSVSQICVILKKKQHKTTNEILTRCFNNYKGNNTSYEKNQTNCCTSEKAGSTKRRFSK